MIGKVTKIIVFITIKKPSTVSSLTVRSSRRDSFSTVKYADYLAKISTSTQTETPQ